MTTMRVGPFLFLIAVVLAIPARAAGPDLTPARLDAARAALGRGDLARAMIELEATLSDLHARLGATLTECLPPPPPGWRADAPETQDLTGAAGGGLSVSRAYVHDDSSLNATLLVDSPGVAAAAQLVAGPQLPSNLRRIRIGTEDALIRWDAATRSGEIIIVMSNRVLLQIEGDGLGSGDILAETARGWNVGSIRKMMGL